MPQAGLIRSICSRNAKEGEHCYSARSSGAVLGWNAMALLRKTFSVWMKGDRGHKWKSTRPDQRVASQMRGGKGREKWTWETILAEPAKDPTAAPMGAHSWSMTIVDDGHPWLPQPFFDQPLPLTLYILSSSKPCPEIRMPLIRPQIGIRDGKRMENPMVTDHLMEEGRFGVQHERVCFFRFDRIKTDHFQSWKSWKELLHHGNPLCKHQLPWSDQQ